jgi:hypothetical protein
MVKKLKLIKTGSLGNDGYSGIFAGYIVPALKKAP